MAQVKIYGEKTHLRRVRNRLSEILHDVNREVLGLPEDKRFHRFLPLAAADFIYPADRTQAYTIIEISLFEGRSAETKRTLLKRLMAEISARLRIPIDDVEITLFETPKANWGIRGRVGDELSLSYDVDR